MADKKPDPSPGMSAFETVVAIVFTLLLVGALIERILNAFEGATFASLFPLFSGGSEFFSNTLKPMLIIISSLLSGFFVFGIVWVHTHLSKLNKEINDFYGQNGTGLETSETSLIQGPKNPKWERVLNHLNSSSPNDWKFAIIEADIMLGDLLDTLRYKGETIAEKLKQVEPSDFSTIEYAWEGHKIRNTIAHEGADFTLSDREARRVIELYRKVFEEFEII